MICEYNKILPKILEISAFKREKDRFFDLYEISDFALVNYIWKITIYKADEKKEIFVNAHSPIVLKWKVAG